MVPSRSLTSSLFVVAILLLLASCAGSPIQAPANQQAGAVSGVQASEIDSLLQLARRAPSPAAEGYQLDAVALMLEAGLVAEAKSQLAEIRTLTELPEELQVRYRVAQANVALAQEEPAIALQALNNPLFESVATLTPDLQVEVRQLRADTMFQSKQYIAAVRERIQMAPLLNQDARVANNNAIWEVLASAPASALTTANNNIDSYELRGWLELVRLINSNQKQRSDPDERDGSVAQHLDSTQCIRSTARCPQYCL